MQATHVERGLVIVFGRACFCVAVAATVLVTASTALAAGPKPAPALTPAARDGLQRALANGEVTPAKYALERALSLFYPAEVRARYGQVARPDPHAATLLLRDLSIRLGDLSRADRKRAVELLARPTDNPNEDDPSNKYGPNEETPVCGTHVCIHYVTSPSNGVSTTDTSPMNGIPDYVEQALDVFENTVWATEVTTMGYRAPKSDVSSTPSNGTSSADPTGAKFDVYLLNLGDDGFYGYCTSDDPNLSGPPLYDYYDMSAYCVLDNDYADPIFDAQPPLANFQVTAAHEFFHAIQAAYDWFEDRWIMEATATWMEDELYDAIDDNLQYLPDSPIRSPAIPLDDFGACCHVYGDWIYFRFLSEWFFSPTAGVTGEDPTVVSDIWTRADGSPVGPDDYSMLAIKNVATARGTSFRKLFAAFGWINRVARRWYDEGVENAYPQAPLSAMTLSRSAPSRSKTPRLNHQTNRYYEFKRGSGVSRTAKLKFVLDLPSRTTGSEASALVFRKTGAIVVYRFSLSSRGNGTFRVPFGSAVAKVDLVLTNASTRYNCWHDPPTPYACQGVPLDDGRTYKFTARLS